MSTPNRTSCNKKWSYCNNCNKTWSSSTYKCCF